MLFNYELLEPIANCIVKRSSGRARKSKRRGTLIEKFAMKIGKYSKEEAVGMHQTEIKSRVSKSYFYST